MKMPYVSIIALILSLMLIAGNSYAESDQQYCEQEAQDAGMQDPQDLKEYIAQCLEEIRTQQGSNNDSSSETKDNVDE